MNLLSTYYLRPISNYISIKLGGWGKMMSIKANSDRLNCLQIPLSLAIYFLKLERRCDAPPPVGWQGMDISWPYKRRELGDTIDYTCPSGTLTMLENLEGGYSEYRLI